MNLSEKLFVLVFVLLPPTLATIALWKAYYNNKFVNDHPDRQWLAIKNVFTSDLSLIKVGVAYRMPWWKMDTVVRINKEEMSTPDGGHTANTKAGGQVRVEARYNVLTGRQFDHSSGQLVKSPTGEEDAGAKDEYVYMAITRTDFSDRAKYVADVLAATIDFVIGQYSYDELMTPTEQVAQAGDHRFVYVPPADLVMGKADAHYNLPRRKIDDKGELLEALGAFIEVECNYRLREVGFNVDEVQLGDLRPASAEVQVDLDRQQRMRSRRRAMGEFAGVDLTDREKLGNIEDLPEIAKAEAQKKMAEAIAQGAQSIADGLRNFGKGT